MHANWLAVTAVQSKILTKFVPSFNCAAMADSEEDKIFEAVELAVNKAMETIKDKAPPIVSNPEALEQHIAEVVNKIIDNCLQSGHSHPFSLSNKCCRPYPKWGDGPSAHIEFINNPTE